MRKCIALSFALFVLGIACLHEAKTQILPLLGAGKGAQVASASTLKTSLISYWEFSSGSLLVDSCSSGGSCGANDLTNNNVVTSDGTAPTIVGNFAQLVSTSSQTLSHVDNASLSVGGTSFSVQAWVYRDTNINGDIIAKSASFGQREYELSIEFTSARIFRFRTYSGGIVVDTDVQSTLNPVTTTWYHVVATFNATSKVSSLYINAGTANTATGTSAVADGTDAFVIGNGSSGGFFNGRIDQAGFWKKELTSSEVSQLYNGGAGLAYSAL